MVLSLLKLHVSIDTLKISTRSSKNNCVFIFGDLTCKDCKVTLILTVPAAVTASHCVKGQQAESLKIVGGTNDITDMDSPTFAVREIIMNAYNDITKAARTFILFYFNNNLRMR